MIFLNEAFIIDILPIYLPTYKQVIKFYTSSKLLLNYLNKLKLTFFTPNNWSELKLAVNL
jgi:hypothetical protein